MIRNIRKQRCAGPLGQSARPLPLRVADPFLRLTETLRDWLLGPTGSGDIRSALSGKSQSSVGCSSHCTGLSNPYLAMESLPLRIPRCLRAMNRPRYRVSGYQAELQVCVDEQGQFANPQTPNPINIGLRLSLRRDRGWLTALIDLLPPDFLVDGRCMGRFSQHLSRCFARNRIPSTDHGRRRLVQSSFLLHAVMLWCFEPEKMGNKIEKSSCSPARALARNGRCLLRAMASVSWQKRSARSAAKGEVCYDSLSASPNLLDEEVASYFLRL